jgi:hypothetical protein
VTQILKLRRWTQAEATEVITAWRRSGLSQRVFCERHEFDAQRLVRWAKLVPDRPAFAEVVVVGSAIVVELGSARVFIDHKVDNNHLARVLRVVVQFTRVWITIPPKRASAAKHGIPSIRQSPPSA